MNSHAPATPDDAPTLDPALLMRGFPPPPEYRVHIGNWQQYPQKIWAFQHTRELFPTRRLEPVGAVRELPVARQPLDDLQCGGKAAPMTWPQMLAATHTDAVVVLHRGRIVDERYFNGMRSEVPHLMFSATKSMAGLMAAVQVAEGTLDENASVGSLLPELAESAWAGATVRQVMDMTDGVDFSEAYTDPQSDIYAYVGAMGWAPQFRKGDDPGGIQAMLGRLKKLQGKGVSRGSAFSYRSPATDVCAWLAMRAANRSLSGWLQQRLWSRLGMEFDGNIMLDPAGTEVAFAGMSASARDLARIGQMLLERGCVDGEQVIPARVVDDLVRGGDVRAFEAGGFTERKGWSYRSQWWVNPNTPRSIAAMGAFGQRLYAFPDAQVVVVLFASHPQPVSALVDPLHRDAFNALLARLEGI